MAEVEEKQTEAATGSDEATKKATKEKKPKKARKTKENKEDSSDKEKPKKVYRNVDTPNVHDMIIEALDVLDERKGVTFQAIKRYMEDNYHVDTTKQASHVRKIMAKCVENGDIIRTRGVGCSGRFKVKHSKPTMIKKRLAPEDYQELPNSKKVSKPKPKPEKKEMATTKKATPAKKVSTPASGKKGRPGRKK